MAVIANSLRRRGAARDDGAKSLLSSESLRVGAIRRLLDLVVSGIVLLLVTPLFLVIALLVLVTDGRPVLFKQRRVGEAGKVFMLYKFRSMRTVADGPAVTAGADARITRLGAFLRRTSLDELPQFWHVLRGQMTLVGPRPESEELAAGYPESCRIVLRARPGLTGAAQMRYREESAMPPPGWTDVELWYLTVLVPLRCAADFKYLQNPSLLQTLRYLGITALVVVGLIDVRQTVEPPQVPPSAARPDRVQDIAFDDDGVAASVGASLDGKIDLEVVRQAP
jgi:lipopolysaccharide/colanic/teichoic acid biosynthesis glycosyltransferase